MRSLVDLLPATRILWLTENYFPNRGGMAQSCDRLVGGLRDENLVVDVIHFSRSAQDFEMQSKTNGEYIRCPIVQDPEHHLQQLWNIVEKISQKKSYSHIIAFGGQLPMIVGPVYAAWSNAALITLIRGNDFDIAVFNPKRRMALSDALTQSAKVCVVSQDKADKIASMYQGVQPIWIPNGINLQQWRPLASDHNRAATWRQENVASNQKVLGIFGHIKKKKGGLFFLNSLLNANLASKFHLLIIGEMEPALIEWINAHQDKIFFSQLPFRDRFALLPMYLACDFIVMPSYYDGLPNVVIEALALGKPLLSSSVGGMADFLIDGVHGYLFPPGDNYHCMQALQNAAQASLRVMRRFSVNCSTLAKNELDARHELDRFIKVLVDTHPKQQRIREYSNL